MTETEQLSGKVSELNDKVEALTQSVQSLLDLWNQAKGIVTFVKWCSYIGAAIGGFTLFIKPYLK